MADDPFLIILDACDGVRKSVAYVIRSIGQQLFSKLLEVPLRLFPLFVDAREVNQDHFPNIIIDGEIVFTSQQQGLFSR